MNAMKDIRLLGILFLALAVRTAMLFSVFADVRRAVTPDSVDCLNLGNTLSWDHEFKQWDTFVVELGLLMGMDGHPEVFRTPGYPALLAAAQWAGKHEAEPMIVKYGHVKDAEAFLGSSPAGSLPHPPDPAEPYQQIILAFQVLVDLHLILLTFFLGRMLASHETGLLAAMLQAVSPLAAAASCRILTDGIFAFMLMAAVLLLLRHFRTGGWWSLMSAGLVMGAACYVRPVGLAFSAVMALAIVCSRRGMGRSTGILPVSSMGILPMSRRAVSALPGTEKTTGEPEGPGTPVLRLHPRPRRFLRMLAFAAIVVACITPWVVRNATVADYWGFSTFATESMYWYSAAEIEARQQHKSVEEVRGQFRKAEGWDNYDLDLSGQKETEEITRQFRKAMGVDNNDDLAATQPYWRNTPCYLTPGGLARYRWDKARGIIFAHPWEFLDIHLRGDAAFWLPDATEALEVLGYTSGGKGTLDVLHRQGLVAAAKHYFGDNTIAIALAGVMVVILLIRYAGIVLCGLWKLRPHMSAAGWLCLLLVLTAWLLPGPANHPRFRVPIEPILSAAAAIGWLGLLQWRRRRRRRKQDC